MPSSALDRLSRLEVSYPMMFKLVNEEMDNLSTHCGVLEFSSPEGIIHVPQWVLFLFAFKFSLISTISICPFP